MKATNQDSYLNTSQISTHINRSNAVDTSMHGSDQPFINTKSEDYVKVPKDNKTLAVVLMNV